MPHRTHKNFNVILSESGPQNYPLGYVNGVNLLLKTALDASKHKLLCQVSLEAEDKIVAGV